MKLTHKIATGLINTFSAKIRWLFIVSNFVTIVNGFMITFWKVLFMRRSLPVFMMILFILICYPVLAEFSASSDVFRKQLRDFENTATGRLQVIPQETPLRQPGVQHQAPSNPKPKSASDNKQQESPSEPKGVTQPAQSGESNNQDPSSLGALPEPLLINKENGLSPTYVPPNLTVPAIPFSFDEDLPKKLMVAPAARAVEKLFAAAETIGIDLVGVSAYRSYETQQGIFRQHVTSSGREEAERVSAPPGHSEHQTGLAIDVSSPSVNNQLVEEFGDTPEGQWLAENAPLYGFIVRFPRDKEYVTGYRYEPWHIRYVGEQFAQAIAAKGLTLEEYLGDRMIARK